MTITKNGCSKNEWALVKLGLLLPRYERLSRDHNDDRRFQEALNDPVICFR